MTTFSKPLAISFANNEALNFVVALTTVVGGSTVPLDLTGATFTSQARPSATSSTIIATHDVTIQGDPTLGIICIHLDGATSAALTAQNGVYDLVMTPSGGDPDNLWQAPWSVIEGITR